ncbi:MAG: hypothetical protein K2X93_13985 [Candidatus Obscuribacterales bacterium]|nr:hypothetical protein [Candidatus Obscuribacterales bacterium]
MHPFQIFGPVLAILLIAHCPSNATSPEKTKTWRYVARTARVALSKKDYKKAIAGYQNAITMLVRSEPQSEKVLNLKLMLVEVYRQQGNLVSAAQLLDQVELSIHNDGFDPLLPARYWQRRADVDFTGSANSKAISELQNSYRVLEKYFSPDSPMMAKSYICLLGLACNTKQYPSVMDALLKLKQTSEKTRKGVGLDLFRGACGRGSESIHALTGQLIKDGNTAQAARVLKQFSETCPTVVFPASLWLFFLDQTMNKGKIGEACMAIPSINKLFDESKSMQRDLETLRIEVDCRIALQTLYGRLGNHNQDVEAQWQRIGEIEEIIGHDANGEDRYRGYQACSIFFAKEVKDGKISDKGLAALQSMNDYTTFPLQKCISPAVDEDFKAFHVNARVELCHFLLLRNEPQKARTVLDSLNHQALIDVNAKDKLTSYRLGRLVIWMAQEFVKQKDLPSAHKAALEANKLIESARPSPDKDRDLVVVNRLLNSITSQLKERNP